MCVSKRMAELRGAPVVLKWPECVWRGTSGWEGYMSVAEDEERAKAKGWGGWCEVVGWADMSNILRLYGSS